MDSYAKSVLNACVRYVAHVYENNPAYRVEILVRKDDAVEPVLRWHDGIIEEVTGGSRFRKGVPVPGFAWEHPRRVYVWDGAEFKSKEDLAAFYVKEFKMPLADTQLLDSHLVKARNVLSVGLHRDGEEPLILSIDTLLEGGLLEEKDKATHLRNGEELESWLGIFAKAFEDSDVAKRLLRCA